MKNHFSSRYEEPYTLIYPFLAIQCPLADYYKKYQNNFTSFPMPYNCQEMEDPISYACSKKTFHIKISIVEAHKDLAKGTTSASSQATFYNKVKTAIWFKPSQIYIATYVTTRIAQESAFQNETIMFLSQHLGY